MSGFVFVCQVIFDNLSIVVNYDGMTRVVVEKRLVKLFPVAKSSFVAFIFCDVFCDYDRTARERIYSCRENIVGIGLVWKLLLLSVFD